MLQKTVQLNAIAAELRKNIPMRDDGWWNQPELWVEVFAILRSLTYSAPFAAPLAYTGLGFLLVMNRMVDSESVEWAQWILLFTASGFIGNFVFSRADHAGNGFFFAVEWVPVAASAVAIGFLSVPLLMRVTRFWCLRPASDFWGFALHTMGNLQGPSVHAFDNFIYGAPPMAPLLFPNLMVLEIIGLWQLRNNVGAGIVVPRNRAGAGL